MQSSVPPVGILLGKLKLYLNIHVQSTANVCFRMLTHWMMQLVVFWEEGSLENEECSPENLLIGMSSPLC